jgi:uncharacterized peroxidase-related enzyme
VVRIHVVSPEEAQGELEKVYREITRARGSIAQVYQVQGLNPRALKAHLELYMALLYGESPLSRRERELLGVVTSQANQCGYCVAHHSDALNRYLRDDGAVKELREGRVPAMLTPRERVLVRWAKTLGKTPPTAADEDVQILRRVGFSDREILDATMIVGYFHFVNRIVIGLGVELEPVGEQKYQY